MSRVSAPSRTQLGLRTALLSRSCWVAGARSAFVRPRAALCDLTWPAAGSARTLSTESVDSALTRALEQIEGSTPFDASKVAVVLVLGGPGVGKGTQCARLVHDYGFVHLSAGDLLRAEQARKSSLYAALIADCIKNGTIVPQQVTIALLRNAIQASLDDADAAAAAARRVGKEIKEGWGAGHGRFLVDGFPRKLDQARTFDTKVVASTFVLYLAAREDVMLQRLLERGKTSGRADDNIESIRKRFRIFEDQSRPVIEYYRAQGKVIQVDATKTPDAVYDDIRSAMDVYFSR